MSDRWSATITLWPFPAAPSAALLGALAEADIDTEIIVELLQGGGETVNDNPNWRSILVSSGEFELRSDELRGFVLSVTEYEANGGGYQFSEGPLWGVLQDAGIAYLIADEGAYEYDGEEISWHPGMSEQRHRSLLKSGTASLSDYEFEQLKVKALTKNTHVSAEKLGELVAAHFQYDPLDWWPGKTEQFEIELPPELKPGARGRKSSLAAD